MTDQGRRTKNTLEIDQRVLAVLYLQPDGMVESPIGRANQRLASLMAVRYDSIVVQRATARLEKQGLIIKDNRVQHPNSRGRSGQQITGLYAVGLAVEKDELPLDLAYVRELKDVIAERTLAKEMRNAPPQPTKEQPQSVRIQPKKSGEGPSAADVADALLAKVIERAKGIAPSNARIERLEHELVNRDRNIDVLTQRLNEAHAEISKLKKAFEAAKASPSARTGLTQALKDSLSEDEWKQLGL